uniref:Uncharacterized protein n=1 Tax=Schizaphis graminum TaxID=13262 RepID=A0A2S2N7G6_SCHGA
MKPFLAFLALEASSIRLRTSALLRSISACFAFLASSSAMVDGLSCTCRTGKNNLDSGRRRQLTSQDFTGLNRTRHCFDEEDERVTLDTQHASRLVDSVAVYL